MDSSDGAHSALDAVEGEGIASQEVQVLPPWEPLADLECTQAVETEASAPDPLRASTGVV